MEEIVMGAILRRRALKRRLEAHQQLGRVALLMELTQIDALDRYRQRLTLPRLALTGIRHSPWRTLYASQDPRAFMSTLALSPEVFAELLALVRACARDRGFFFIYDFMAFCSLRRGTRRACPGTTADPLRRGARRPFGPRMRWGWF
jgi:hypothetical protein